MTAQPVPLPDMAPNVSQKRSQRPRGASQCGSVTASASNVMKLCTHRKAHGHSSGDRKRPHLTEYGVVFGAVRERPDRNGKPEGGMPTWFKIYELRPCP